MLNSLMDWISMGILLDSVFVPAIRSDSPLFSFHIFHMYFLATLVTVFLVAATVIPQSNSEELTLASLPSLDSQSFDLSPSGAATAGNESNLINANLEF